MSKGKLTLHDRYDANRLRERAPFSTITRNVRAYPPNIPSQARYTHCVIDRNGDIWASYHGEQAANEAAERLNLRAAQYIMTEA